MSNLTKHDFAKRKSNDQIASTAFIMWHKLKLWIHKLLLRNALVIILFVLFPYRASKVDEVSKKWPLNFWDFQAEIESRESRSRLSALKTTCCFLTSQENFSVAICLETIFPLKAAPPCNHYQHDKKSSRINDNWWVEDQKSINCIWIIEQQIIRLNHEISVTKDKH